MTTIRNAMSTSLRTQKTMGSPLQMTIKIMTKNWLEDDEEDETARFINAAARMVSQ